ncbi:AzlD family protein [Taklimakanibacter lacteus]|uniref:AzlD family protein n=1 Tax=Taklimakanibacter lacteus TaxID=2268456 RepID=UPI000E674328
MTLHLSTLLAIIGMALATYATRVAGLFLMRHVNVKGRTKAAFDALPPAILMAVIAPTILATGIAETIAAAITAGSAMLRLPMIVTVLIGMVSVVLLRMAM